MEKKILEKFFANEASEAEVQQVLQWFEVQELNPWNMQTLEELWNQIDESDFVAHDDEEILEHIHHQIRKSDHIHTVRERSILKKWYQSDYDFRTWSKVAAVLITVGVFVFLGTNYWLSGNAENGNTHVTRLAKAGEKKKLTLSDGTVIHLNAGSRITFPKKFAKTSRKVFLAGEAFFDVKKDHARPFIVRTENLSTTVLGTSFNIRSYENGKQTDVLLATGRLKVEHNNTDRDPKSYILNPGEAAVLDKKDNTLKKIQYDPKLSLGWIEGILVFQDADLDEMITRIERWYGVTIEVENRERISSQQWRYRGIFGNEPLEDVLKGISYVKDFTFEIENKRVKIIF